MSLRRHNARPGPTTSCRPDSATSVRPKARASLASWPLDGPQPRDRAHTAYRACMEPPTAGHREESPAISEPSFCFLFPLSLISLFLPRIPHVGTLRPRPPSERRGQSCYPLGRYPHAVPRNLTGSVTSCRAEHGTMCAHYGRHEVEPGKRKPPPFETGPAHNQASVRMHVINAHPK